MKGNRGGHRGNDRNDRNEDDREEGGNEEERGSLRDMLLGRGRGEPESELFAEIAAMLNSMDDKSKAHNGGIFDAREEWDAVGEPMLQNLLAFCNANGIPFQYNFMTARDEEQNHIVSGLGMSRETHSCEMMAASHLQHVPHSISHFILFLYRGREVLERLTRSELPPFVLQDVQTMFGAAMAAMMVRNVVREDEGSSEDDKPEEE